jgi:hypothetical protein
VGRGARVLAQIQEEDRARVVVPYRAKPEQKTALEEVFHEEQKKERKKRLSLSKVVEFVVGLGLDIYWVRHELGAELDAWASEHAWDRRQALREVIRRGLAKGKR